MKIRNFVKKHTKSNGAGVHIDKIGKHMPRSKQKHKFKNEIKNIIDY